MALAIYLEFNHISIDLARYRGKTFEINKLKEGDLMECCKPKDDDEMKEHQKDDKGMEGHRGGCCGGGYKMWIVLGIVAVVIWYLRS